MFSILKRYLRIVCSDRYFILFSVWNANSIPPGLVSGNTIKNTDRGNLTVFFTLIIFIRFPSTRQGKNLEMVTLPVTPWVELALFELIPCEISYSNRQFSNMISVKIWIRTPNPHRIQGWNSGLIRPAEWRVRRFPKWRVDYNQVWGNILSRIFEFRSEQWNSKSPKNRYNSNV